MESARSSRISGLDCIKALALYLVVLYHLTFRNAPDVFSGRVLPLLAYGLGTLMSCCVPLLFLVSGALAVGRPVNLRGTLRRSGRVLLLTVFWAVASLLIVLLLRQEAMTPGMFFYTASQLEVGYIQHLWYMPTFLFLCLITPLMQSLRQNSRSVYRYGLGLLFLFTFGNLFLSDCEYLLRYLTGHLGHTGNRQFFWFTNFFVYHYWYCPVYYGIGTFLVEHRADLRKYRKWALGTIPLCAVCLTVFALARCHVRGDIFDPVFNNYGNVFTLLLTLSVVVLLMDVQPGAKLSRCMKSISDCSLGIYLIHWLLIEALMDFLPALTSTNRFAPLTALAVMGLSWALSWGLSKVPLVRLLLTVSPKRKKQA